MPRHDGEVWTHFSKTEVPYSGFMMQACCNYCKPVGLTPSQLSELTAMQDLSEAQKRRSKELGCVPGKTADMIRHLKLHCADVPAAVRAQAAEFALSSTEKRSRSTPSSTESRSRGEKPPRGKQARIYSYRAGGERTSYNKTTHGHLIAELLASSNISFRALCSPEFRALQAFYMRVGERDVAARGLAVTHAKILKEFLPSREAIALKRKRDAIAAGPLFEHGYTLADDGWASRAKSHFSGITIGRPGAEAHTAAILPISAEELDGLSIARNWELLILESSKPPEEESELLSKFIVRLARPPDAFCSDSAGANVKARAIMSLRHPDRIWIPCFAHIAALQCGDLLTKSSKSRVISDMLHIVMFFNCSSSKWLPRLRDKMEEVFGKGKWFALCTGSATRWTTSWLSGCSVLRAKTPLQMLALAASSELVRARRSRDRSLEGMKRAFASIQDETFWNDLLEYMRLMVPTIESSLVLQGGSATLADVVYCHARQYQALSASGESVVIRALEKRWKLLEMPLLLLCFFLSPKYNQTARGMVNDAVPILSIVTWVEFYYARWIKSPANDDLDAAPDALIGVTEWLSGVEPWAQRCKSAANAPATYWSFVEQMHSRDNSSRGASITALAKVACKLFAVLPSAADPERLFSQLGRIVAPDRTHLLDSTVTSLSVISADVRSGRAGDRANAANAARDTRKLSSSAEASLRLSELADSDLSSILEAPESLDNRGSESNSACSLSAGEDEVQAAPAAAPTACSASGAGSPIVVDGAEGAEIEDEHAHLQDASATDASYDSRDDLALADVSAFIDSISTGVAQLDAAVDDFQDDNFSLCTEEEELRRLSIEAHPIGKLPRHNEQGVHQDQMTGVRGLKTPLSKLFSLDAVGKLKAMTTIGKL